MGVSKLAEEEGKIRQKRKEEFRGKVDDIFFLVFPGRNSIEYQQIYKLTYQQRFTVLRTTSWYCTINALNSVVGKSVGIELNRPPAGAAV